MQITLYSFVSALFWSSLWIIVIYVLRRTRWKQSLGILPIMLAYLFCAARLLLPLTFPLELVTEEGAPYYYCNLFLRKRAMLTYNPVLLALAIVWLAGFCVFLVRYIRQYRRAIRIIERYAEPWDERAQTVLEQIQRQTERAIKIKGYTVAHISSAFSVGVLRKRIILPDKDYTEADLRYILTHEYTHFLHYDTLTKLLTTLFGIIFWWNPIARLLQRDWEQVIELKCDQFVTAPLNAQERAAYLRTILSMIKQSDQKRLPFAEDSLTLFQSNVENAEDNMKERFAAVTTYPERRKKINASVIFTSVFATLFFISYFVFPPKADDSSPYFEKYFSRDAAYILCDPSGTYWICINDDVADMSQDSNGTRWLHIDGMEPIPISTLVQEFIDNPTAHDSTDVKVNYPSPKAPS